MGDAKRKKLAFLAKHPFCCFCGGTVLATTVDHIPARTCFRGRQYPEEFEFPACGPCNMASRLDEIAFSFYTKMTDHTDANFENSEAEKSILGMVNNLPHLLPMPSRDGRRNRRNLALMGITKPVNKLASELPMVTIPPDARAYLLRYARKIAVALFYRDKGHPAALTHQIIMDWGQLVDASFMKRAEGFLTMPNLHIGERSNASLGNQFAYRHVQANEPDVYGLIAQFGTGIVICGMIVSAEIADRLTFDAQKANLDAFGTWTPVRENYPILK